MLDETRTALEEEWGAVKGYLRIEKGRPVWFADPSDPEEAFIVERLRHVFLLTDPEGRVMQRSETYASIGVESPAEIREILAQTEPVYRIRRTPDGTPYLIKAGILSQQGRGYFLAIGRSLAAREQTSRRFLFNYFSLVPVVIALSALAGWLVAGRTLRPVEDVARAAERITSANLHVRIPHRGAGDELDRFIESFNQMTERLDQSFDQIRRFSVDVSHDLRTPLTAVRGQLEVALMTASTPAEYREAIANALEDVERLASLVRSLLLLAQAEAGQVTLQTSIFDAAAATRDVVEQFQIPAEEAGLTLRYTGVPAQELEADRTQFERLLTNLLSNALKYTPSGGQITVGAGSEGSVFILEVADTGVGIPADKLPHIFDRYYRVKSGRTDRVQGLGLGLSFVHWIVRAHHGEIQVDSKEGKGTRFRIRLPKSQPPSKPSAAAIPDMVKPLH
jgi:heavy metal sensor kinase